MRSWGSWVSEIRAPNQKTRIWLGSYSTPEAAARAYDAALLCLKGSSANLNFPMSAPSFQLPHDSSVMSPKSIQRVAGAAANSFVDHHQQHQHHNPSIPSSVSDPSPSSSFSSSTSSSSMVSSPSLSSSQSEQLIEDSISFTPSLGYAGIDATYGMIDGDNASSMVMVNEPWFDLSPKYMDTLMNSVFFDPTAAPSMNIEEFYEEEDLPLWSFC